MISVLRDPANSVGAPAPFVADIAPSGAGIIRFRDQTDGATYLFTRYFADFTLNEDWASGSLGAFLASWSARPASTGGGADR